MRKIVYLLILTATYATAQTKPTAKEAIQTVLNNWHKAAAEAKFDTYFGMMTTDAIYIGTDPTENWKLEEFKAFAKPYFARGSAWDFTPLERNIYFSPDKATAWFDELLSTQMGICRGSGIMQRQKNGDWKIAHYVLSIAVPNDNTDELTRIKSAFDTDLIQKLKKAK